MSLFRPCIDLHHGLVKQIVGSSLTDSDSTVKTNFVAAHDAGWFARLYRADHLAGGHVIQLGPGNVEAAKQALGAWPGGLELGGGVTAENARMWLDAGASRVIVTSYIFADGEFKRENLDRLLAVTGRERLVLDLSCRRRDDGNYYIVTDRWQKFTRMRVERASLEMLAGSAAEFLIHAVDVEGKQSGIDGELLRILAENSPLPCVYAGGIASFADVEKIEREGGGRIGYTIGSALDIFGGSLRYREVVERAARQSQQEGR